VRLTQLEVRSIAGVEGRSAGAMHAAKRRGLGPNPGAHFGRARSEAVPVDQAATCRWCGKEEPQHGAEKHYFSTRGR